MARVFYYPSTAIRVCVDEVTDAHIMGKICCAQVNRPIEFSDLGSLLLTMEDIFDKRGYPDAFQRKRRFLSGDDANDRVTKEDILKSKDYRELIPNDEGKCDTFLVFVLSRCNSSWQGRIEWIDGSEPKFFDSALEFLRLVDEHLTLKVSKMTRIG